ncbi:transcriptional regulator MalT [compost metagenome]
MQDRIKFFESSSIFDTTDDEVMLQNTELNERQKEIAILILNGFSNTEIALRLCIATTTVKYHIKNIYRIYSVKNKHQLYKKIIVKNDTIPTIE